MGFHVIQSRCIGCGGCLPGCPTGALRAVDRRVVVEESLCIDCWLCVEVCPADALEPAVAGR